MADEAFPDVEGAFRDYLRAETQVTAIVGNRAFFGVPVNAGESSYPMLVVSRVGGGDDPSADVPMDQALVQIDAWGEVDGKGFGDKTSCRALANAVRRACRKIRSATTQSGVILYGAVVQSDLWLPDPDTRRPRYAITVVVTAIVP